MHVRLSLFAKILGIFVMLGGAYAGLALILVSRTSSTWKNPTVAFISMVIRRVDTREPRRYNEP